MTQLLLSIQTWLASRHSDERGATAVTLPSAGNAGGCASWYLDAWGRNTTDTNKARSCCTAATATATATS